MPPSGWSRKRIVRRVPGTYGLQRSAWSFLPALHKTSFSAVHGTRSKGNASMWAFLFTCKNPEYSCLFFVLSLSICNSYIDLIFFEKTVYTENHSWRAFVDNHAQIWFITRRTIIRSLFFSDGIIKRCPYWVLWRFWGLFLQEGLIGLNPRFLRCFIFLWTLSEHLYGRK